jgi:preprotein translocase subunit SecF
LVTSETTLAIILVIWIFAGESLAGFAIALFSWVLVGTFSSIAISATVSKLLSLSVDYYQKKKESLCHYITRYWLARSASMAVFIHSSFTRM